MEPVGLAGMVFVVEPDREGKVPEADDGLDARALSLRAISTYPRTAFSLYTPGFGSTRAHSMLKR